MADKSFAFLYNSDLCSDSFYGFEINSVLLSNLQKVDKSNSVESVWLSGDLLLQTLCQRTLEVGNDDGTNYTKVGFDIETYQTFVFELVETIFDGVCYILDKRNLPETIARQNIHCVCIDSIDENIVQELNNLLAKSKFYIGCFEVDTGNPLHYTLFYKLLIKQTYYKNGYVYSPSDSEGFVRGCFPNESIAYFSDDKFYELLESCREFQEISERGERSLHILESRNKLSESEKIAEALRKDEKKIKSSFQTEINIDIIEFTKNETKFVKYLLELSHKDGHSKAKFFNESLAIYQDDWRYLAAQFYYGIKNSITREIKEVLPDGAIKYSAIINIIGRNKRVAQVRVAFILHNNTLKITSAYPEKNHKINHEPIVPPIAEQYDDYQKIYDMANYQALEAANKCVPTPMYLSNGSYYMEGLCGYAFVIIRDARKGFAKWLRKNHIGFARHGSNCSKKLQKGEVRS